MGCCKNCNKNDGITNYNYIDAEINIQKGYENKEIRIINTFEESKRKYFINFK